MSNRQVQEKLCTEPKEESAATIPYAIAFREGLRSQKTIGTTNVTVHVKVKEEPVFVVYGRGNKAECWRCGAENSTTAQEHREMGVPEGWINAFRFETIIDTGSPVTIFAVDKIKKVMCRKDLQVR